jgi:hypothetical protein
MARKSTAPTQQPAEKVSTPAPKATPPAKPDTSGHAARLSMGQKKD